MRPVVRIILIGLVALLLGRLVIVLVLRPESRAWFSPDYWQQSAKIGQVLRLVNAHYVDEDSVEFDELSHDALDAMLQGLDRYSDFLDPEEFADFEISADQHYAGIGVEIERLNRRITVVAVFQGSPAEGAGVQPGDQIVAVDGDDTRDFGLREIVALIRGPIGSPVPVTFYRPGEGEEFTADIVRQDVDFPTVRDVELSPDKIGYIRLTQFSRRSGEEVAEALDKLEAQGMQALILDLRGNPGGLLPASVDIAGAFLPEGSLVVSTRGRKGETERQERTQSPPRKGDYPLALLVDGASASASEIVAGALQDSRRAIVVGEQTVGKGSVQSVIFLKEKEAVRMTTARYYLPSGRTINEVGVTPDVLVQLTDQERLKMLAQRPYRDMPEVEFKEKFGVSKLPDRQRVTADAILRGVLSFGQAGT